jgi:hypothetical protein
MLFFLVFFGCLQQGCQQQTDPRGETPEEPPEEPLGEPLDSLVNTLWSWNSSWGARRLFFVSGNEVIYTDQDEGEYTESYTYDESEKRGRINYYGEFKISADNKTMRFTEWKNYGHGSDFTFVERRESAE